MTTYYDTLYSGLVPCKPLSRIDNGKIKVKITKTVKVYKKGDELNISPMYFVEKVKSSGCYIMVKQAAIGSDIQ